MAGIKSPILDVITRLKTIIVRSPEGHDTTLFSRIWNNQHSHQHDGSGYVFPRPAAFVEIINDVTFEIIGLGVRSADLGFRIHLIHDYYNGDDMEQDLAIFDLRDQILAPDKGLSQFMPTSCSPLNCVREASEYDHDNTYHYTLDFVCNFIDSKGSKFDEGQGMVTEVTPNLDADIEAEFIIPQ